MALQLKSVEPGRGPRWVGDAFRLFARRPLAFAMMFVAFLFAALVAALVPLVGGVLQMMLLPLLTLGFMVASQSALLDGPVGPMQFIEPLRGDPARRRALLLLCVGYGLCAGGILLLCDVLSHNAMGRLQALLTKGPSAQREVDALLSEPGVSVAALLGLTLGSLLSVPFWHAPALVHWGGQGVAQSLFSSALAVWRSKGALTVYMLTWAALIMLFGVGAALVFGLLGAGQLAGLASVPAGLLFTTVFYISLLFTFNDSFGSAGPRAASIDPQAR
jgi:hypothetical protein